MALSKRFVDERLRQVEAYPQMWGTNDAIESMVVTILECEAPEDKDVLVRYRIEVGKRFGSNQPLHQVTTGTDFIPALLEIAEKVRVTSPSAVEEKPLWQIVRETCGHGGRSSHEEFEKAPWSKSELEAYTECGEAVRKAVLSSREVSSMLEEAKQLGIEELTQDQMSILTQHFKEYGRVAPLEGVLPPEGDGPRYGGFPCATATTPEGNILCDIFRKGIYRALVHLDPEVAKRVKHPESIPLEVEDVAGILEVAAYVRSICRKEAK